MVTVVLTDYEENNVLDALVSISHQRAVVETPIESEYSLTAAISRWRHNEKLRGRQPFGITWFVDGPMEFINRAKLVSWRKRYVQKVFQARQTMQHDAREKEVHFRDTGYLIARAHARSIYFQYLLREDKYSPHFGFEDCNSVIKSNMKAALHSTDIWPPIFNRERTHEIIQRSTRWAP